MNKKNSGRTPVYDNSFKIAVALEYLNGKDSAGVLGRKYGIDRDTVSHFVRWYRKQGPAPSTRPVNGVLETPGTVAPTQQSASLSQALKEANLKIAALEMLIATANKELGIDIVKKPGTKPSQQ